MKTDFSSQKFERLDWLLFGGFVLLKIIIHLFTDGPGQYGYFRDELYYLDCATHLDWGYVDHPPLSILILAITRGLFGSSMLSIRMPVILIGAATVVLSGLVAREMGGGRFSQALTCLAVLVAPVFLTMGSFFSMNAFDQFFWALGAYLIALLIRTDDARLWLWFGLAAGLGLENKLSMAFFGLGLIAAMILTPMRKHFLKWRFWVGGLIAVVLFLPHIIWQLKYDWPTLEFMRNARLFKNMPTTLVKFFLGQIILIGPLNAPLWVAGLLFGLLSKRGGAFRHFSIIYIVAFVVFYLTNGKVYYLSPAYPMLLALGAVWLEGMLVLRRRARAAVAVFLFIGGLAMAPYAIPVLPVETFLRYQEALGLRAPQQERAHTGLLPQHFGDRFGWEEFVSMVGDAYNKLDPVDRTRCSIFVSNFAEAGAIDLFGQRFGLPRAISGHMTHYIWGPGNATGEVMLVYWNEREELGKLFEEVIEVARFHHPYVMDRQNNRPLYLCRRLKLPVRQAWKQVKIFQ